MNIPLFIAFFVVVYAFIYILYCQGFAVLRRTTAIMIIFRHGKNADKATLDSCTGWVKHAGKFRESKTYEFFLDAQLSKGNVEVILLDRKKQSLMKLNPQSPTYKIELDVRNRYYLRWEFKGATGKCELRW
ncbi:MAG: hypothetical protein HDR05_07900 [Lachnospiraceae bacterium]|nr:hypothetical protein [Lachnospiraceae bacterium]